jgi:hypothetical protein
MNCKVVFWTAVVLFAATERFRDQGFASDRIWSRRSRAFGSDGPVVEKFLLAPAPDLILDPVVCTENLSSGVMVMESAQDGK